MTLPCSLDRSGQILEEIEDQPPSARHLAKPAGGSHGGCSVCRAAVAEPEERSLVVRPLFAGSHGGCSVCRMTAVYDAGERRIHVELPADAAPPDEMEVTVEVAADGWTRRFRPSDAEVRALLDVREADWFVPLDVSGPARMTLSLSYREGRVREVSTRVVTVG